MAWYSRAQAVMGPNGIFTVFLAYWVATGLQDTHLKVHTYAACAALKAMRTPPEFDSCCLHACRPHLLCQPHQTAPCAHYQRTLLLHPLPTTEPLTCIHA